MMWSHLIATSKLFLANFVSMLLTLNQTPFNSCCQFKHSLAPSVIETRSWAESTSTASSWLIRWSGGFVFVNTQDWLFVNTVSVSIIRITSNFSTKLINRSTTNHSNIKTRVVHFFTPSQTLSETFTVSKERFLVFNDLFLSGLISFFFLEMIHIIKVKLFFIKRDILLL